MNHIHATLKLYCIVVGVEVLCKSTFFVTDTIMVVNSSIIIDEDDHVQDGYREVVGVQ